MSFFGSFNVASGGLSLVRRMLSSCSCCSVIKSCPILPDPMDCSMPDFFPVLQHLLEFGQVCICWTGDAIQPSVALFSFCLQSFSASGSFPMSQLFASNVQSTGVSASVSTKSIQNWFHLRLTYLISLLSKGLSRVFSRTTVQNIQFFSALPSLLSSSHIHTWLL